MFMKKLLSVFLSVLMLFGTLGVCFSAEAAEADCITVTVSGMQKNAEVKTAIDGVNGLRAANGIAPITADKNLTAIAKRYAAALEIHADNDFNLPDGSLVNLYLPNISVNQAIAYKVLSDTSAESIKVFMTTGIENLPLDLAGGVNSVGIAAFQSGSDCIAVAALSTEPASEIQTDFINESYSAKELLSADYIKEGVVYYKFIKNGKYTLSAKVKGTGVSSAAYKAEGNIKYSSSKKSVFKVKGKNGYAKKNGEFKLSAKTASGKVFATAELKYDSGSVKMYIASVTSKKKQMTVKWQKNVTNASGYELQYSTDKKFKKGVKKVTIKGKKNVKKTIKKLKSKKTYYVRVRAYVNQGEGEKIYSSWSSKSKIKIK